MPRIDINITPAIYNEKYTFEDFSQADMDDIKDLVSDGMIDPVEILRELDYINGMTLNKVVQICEALIINGKLSIRDFL